MAVFVLIIRLLIQYILFWALPSSTKVTEGQAFTTRSIRGAQTSRSILSANTLFYMQPKSCVLNIFSII